MIGAARTRSTILVDRRRPRGPCPAYPSRAAGSEIRPGRGPCPPERPQTYAVALPARSIGRARPAPNSLNDGEEADLPPSFQSPNCAPPCWFRATAIDESPGIGGPPFTSEGMGRADQFDVERRAPNCCRRRDRPLTTIRASSTPAPRIDVRGRLGCPDHGRAPLPLLTPQPTHSMAWSKCECTGPRSWRPRSEMRSAAAECASK